MTIFAKKKDSSNKKEVSTKSNNAPTNTTASNVSIANSESDGSLVGRDQSETHQLLPTQAEEMGLRNGLSDILTSGSLNGSSLWSQGITLGSDLRSQGHYDYDYHMDNTNTSRVKRRHCLSPIRTVRAKHSRVERDRSTNSSPSTCVVPNVIVQSVEPTTPHVAIQNMPSPDRPTCNSEDEYESPPSALQLTEEEWIERERRFEKKMRKKGWRIKRMDEDGACLFRAVADQVYGDQEMHDIVRKQTMDYISANRDYYSPYVTEDFKNYVSRKRLDNCHGNHIEIQAMCEMYNRTIEVFCYSTDPINAFHGVNKTDNAPIRLSYHRGVHYNSVVDPYNATFGEGLGLPVNHPALTNKDILKEVARQTDEIQIEQAMLEDKLRATDWEATNEAIEEQVARESYLQWLKDNERRNRSLNNMGTSSSSTVTSSSVVPDIRSPRSRSHGSSCSGNLSPHSRSDLRNSPSRHSPPPPCLPGPSSMINNIAHTSTKTSSSFAFIKDAEKCRPQSPCFEMSDWEADDAGILAQVMAASQQEYFDNLKRAREVNNTNSVSNFSTSTVTNELTSVNASLTVKTANGIDDQDGNESISL